ncbi:MAG: YciI family protein [Kofleriaceae bacterium]
MQYLLLIYDDEKARWNASAEKRAEIMNAYKSLVGELAQTEMYLGGNSLDQTTKASSVRVRDGKLQITDGPFAETREQLGGYFLIEAPDVATARAIAARMPGAANGTVEVRPVVPIPA